MVIFREEKFSVASFHVYEQYSSSLSGPDFGSLQDDPEKQNQPAYVQFSTVHLHWKSVTAFIALKNCHR